MSAPGRPLPLTDGEAQPFWVGCRDGRLLLQRCMACGAWRFPPGLVCRSCASTDAGWVAASGGGTVYSFTVVHRTPIKAFAAETPYVLALIDLDEGVRMMARIAPAATVPEIGARVEVAFQEIDETVTLPTFHEVPDA
jgi:uncharacterized OB-fold protein